MPTKRTSLNGDVVDYVYYLKVRKIYTNGCLQIIRLMALCPLFNRLIDFLSMNNAENQDFFADDFKDYAIIADPQLPVTPERFTKRFTVSLGFGCKPMFDGSFDAVFQFRINQGQVFGLDIRMVSKCERHDLPNLVMLQRL